MPSDVFGVINRLTAPLPYKCAQCGSDLHDYIDFRLTIDYYGAVLVCLPCIKELAKVEESGLILKSEVDAVLAENELLRKQAAALLEIRRKFEDDLVAVVDTLHTRIDDATSGVDACIESTVEESKVDFDFFTK